jgi:hypothetical protein
MHNNFKSSLRILQKIKITSETFVGFNLIIMGLIIYHGITGSNHSPLTELQWLCVIILETMGILLIADDVSGKNLVVRKLLYN